MKNPSLPAFKLQKALNIQEFIFSVQEISVRIVIGAQATCYWRASDMLLMGQTKTKIAFFGKYITYSSFHL
jgi:hypothetical protein